VQGGGVGGLKMAGKCWFGKWREEIGIKEKINVYLISVIAGEFDFQKETFFAKPRLRYIDMIYCTLRAL
jgi:hypothetical protein